MCPTCWPLYFISPGFVSRGDTRHTRTVPARHPGMGAWESRPRSAIERRPALLSVSRCIVLSSITADQVHLAISGRAGRVRLPPPSWRLALIGVTSQRSHRSRPISLRTPDRSHLIPPRPAQYAYHTLVGAFGNGAPFLGNVMRAPHTRDTPNAGNDRRKLDQGLTVRDLE